MTCRRPAEAGVIFSDLPTRPASSRSSCGGTWAVARRRTRTRTSGRSRRPRWTGGTFLYVPRGVVVDETLVARHRPWRGRGAPSRSAWSWPRRAAASRSWRRSARPTGSPPGTAASPTWSRAGRASALREPPAARRRGWNVGAQRVEVGQDADVTTLNAEVGLGGHEAGRRRAHDRQGRHVACCSASWRRAATSTSTSTASRTFASHTTTDLLYLSALYDQARAAFYGVTRVRHGAKQTSSYQECRNLLLSPGGRRGADPGARDRGERHPALRPWRHRRAPSTRRSSSTRSPAAWRPRRRSA